MCYFNFFQFLFSFGDECVAHMQRANFVDEIRSVKCRICVGCLRAVDRTKQRKGKSRNSHMNIAHTSSLSLSFSLNGRRWKRIWRRSQSQRAQMHAWVSYINNLHAIFSCIKRSHWCWSTEDTRNKSGTTSSKWTRHGRFDCMCLQL